MSYIVRAAIASVSRCAVGLLLLASIAPAQVRAEAMPAGEPVGMVEQPCPPALELPAAARHLLTELFLEPRKLTPADLERLASNAQFKEFSAANRLRAETDWAGLCRYHSSNPAVSSSTVQPLVVLMGDSITENWALGDPAFFDERHLDRGISGQTSPQMLVRFRSDVVALRPKIVHILAGTNDIAGNTGPTSAQDFENDIMSMVESAHVNGIRVLIGSIPPCAAFGWQPRVNPKPWIRQLNAWLRAYALQHDAQFIDYYSVLAGPSGEFRADLSNDGVHPNRDGYRLMRGLLEKALRRFDR